MLLLLMFRDGDAVTTECTYTYDVDEAYTYDVDEAYTYAPCEDD